MTNPIHYRLALDALPQLVWVAVADGTLEYLNRRCADYSGVAIDDLLGWDWSWIVHPSDLPETLRVWKMAIRSGTPHEIEQRLRRYDGEYRWFLCRAEPVRDSENNIVRWFGTCTDIDESRRTADQLRAVRMLFRALVERAEDGFVLASSDGTVRYANPAAASLLDYTPEELSGTDLWCSAHPDDRAKLMDWLAGLVANAGARVSITVRFIQRGGVSRRLEVFGTNLLPDPDVRGISVQLRKVEETNEASGTPSGK